MARGSCTFRERDLRAAVKAARAAGQIMAISGHRSLAEAEKYVRAVNQLTLARAAMKQTYAQSETRTEIGKPENRFAKNEK